MAHDENNEENKIVAAYKYLKLIVNYLGSCLKLLGKNSVSLLCA